MNEQDEPELDAREYLKQLYRAARGYNAHTVDELLTSSEYETVRAPLKRWLERSFDIRYRNGVGMYVVKREAKRALEEIAAEVRAAKVDAWMMVVENLVMCEGGVFADRAILLSPFTSALHTHVRFHYCDFTVLVRTETLRALGAAMRKKRDLRMRLAKTDSGEGVLEVRWGTKGKLVLREGNFMPHGGGWCVGEVHLTEQGVK